MVGRTPTGQHAPATVGSEAGGFRIQAKPSALRITAWGYWSEDVVGAFSADAVAALRGLTQASAFVFDAADLKPQGADGQEALRVLLRALSNAKFARGLVIAKNALTRMQLARLLREGGLDARLELGDGSSDIAG